MQYYKRTQEQDTRPILPYKQAFSKGFINILNLTVQRQRSELQALWADKHKTLDLTTPEKDLGCWELCCGRRW